MDMVCLSHQAGNGWFGRLVFGSRAIPDQIFKILPLLQDEILALFRRPVSGMDDFLAVFMDRITHRHAEAEQHHGMAENLAEE